MKERPALCTCYVMLCRQAKLRLWLKRNERFFMLRLRLGWLVLAFTNCDVECVMNDWATTVPYYAHEVR